MKMMSHKVAISVCLMLSLQVLMQLNGQLVGTKESYCKICANHTMCLYTTIGIKCGKPISRLLTQEMRLQILNVHNELRNKIALGLEKIGSPGPQPPAADMMKMQWDYELEAVAQMWADQCTFGHDECRRIRDLKVGQNMAITGTTAKISNLDQDWYNRTAIAWYSNEVKLFNNAYVSPFVFLSDYGHYTQLLWSTTNLIGCGFTQFKDGDTDLIKKLYVCNYAPAGNIIASYMYKAGPACSQCPANKTCKDITYKGLCD